jgi:hypothetical protein
VKSFAKLKEIPSPNIDLIFSKKDCSQNKNQDGAF